MDKKISFITIIISASLVIANNVLATSYYVSPTATASWNECTDINMPCSLNTANQNAKAGDTVYLMKGIYRNIAISPSNSGSPAKILTFSAYPGDYVLFYNCTFGKTSCGIEIKNKEHIRIYGIHINYSDPTLNIQNSSHIEISHCTFTNYKRIPNTETIRGGWIMHNSSYNWIHHCIFAKAGLTSSSCDDISAPLYIGDPLHYDNSSYNLIENNIFYHGGHHLLEIGGGNHNVVRNNYMHNEGWMDCVHCSGKPVLCGNRDLSVSGLESRRNLIENNTFAFTGIPPDNTVGAGAEITSDYNIIRYNRFYNTTASGLRLYDKGWSTSNHNYVYSNTFYQCGYNNYTTVEGAIRIIRGTGNAIKNNIFYQNYNNNTIGYLSTTSEEQTIENNWKEKGNPLFINPVVDNPFNQSIPDLRLQHNSSCIDSGGYLAYITAPSGSGTSFIVNDAGYFSDGWGIIEGDMIQLEGSTQRAVITNIDYDTNTLTLDRQMEWKGGQGISLAYDGVRPDIGAYEYHTNCVRESDCPELECNKKSCIDGSCFYSPDPAQDGVKCADTDNYECTTNFRCRNGFCSGENNHTVCIDSYSSCSNAVCDPLLYPRTGCGNYQPRYCRLEKDMLAYYAFDSGFEDSTNNSQILCSPGRCPKKTAGISGNGYLFDGNDSLNMQWHRDALLYNFTLALWIMLNENASSEMYGNNPLWSDDGSSLVIRPSSILGRIHFGFLGSSTTPSNINKWSHIAFLRTGNRTMLYYNGILKTSWKTDKEPVDFSSSVIGRDNQNLHGVLDELRIYGRALSGDEILELYNMSFIHQCITPVDTPPCDGRIDLHELLSFINKWKRNDATLRDIIIAIRVWKNG